MTRRVKHEGSWKDEEIENLIGLHEQRICLWDFGSEEYINRSPVLHVTSPRPARTITLPKRFDDYVLSRG